MKALRLKDNTSSHCLLHSPRVTKSTSVCFSNVVTIDHILNVSRNRELKTDELSRGMCKSNVSGAHCDGGKGPRRTHKIDMYVAAER